MLTESRAVVSRDGVDNLVDSTAVSEFGMKDEDAFVGLDDKVLAIRVGAVSWGKDSLCEGVQGGGEGMKESSR